MMLEVVEIYPFLTVLDINKRINLLLVYMRKQGYISEGYVVMQCLLTL